MAQQPDPLSEALYRDDARHWLPVDVPYAHRLLRAAGCRCETALLGWMPEQGPRCRLCGTIARLPTVLLWEALLREREN